MDTVSFRHNPTPAQRLRVRCAHLTLVRSWHCDVLCRWVCHSPQAGDEQEWMWLSGEAAPQDRLPCEPCAGVHIRTQLRCHEPRGAMSFGSPMPRGEQIA